jgi:hypothetical protein
LLYPKAWRLRYGVEFDALLEDASPRWGDAIDVLCSALEMRMRTWNFFKLAVVCGLAGAVLAAVLAFRMPDKYVSEAVLRVSGNHPSPDDFHDRVLQQALSPSSLQKLILKHDLYSTDRQGMALEGVVERLRRDIAITVTDRAAGDPKNFSFAVRYISHDPARAQRTTADLVAGVMAANVAEGIAATKRAESTGERRNSGITVELVAAASLPQTPVMPNRLTITALGVAAGVGLAALAALVLRLRLAPQI